MTANGERRGECGSLINVRRAAFAAPFAIRCHFSMSPDAFNSQGTLKSDSEWRTARRMWFNNQCSPSHSPRRFTLIFRMFAMQCPPRRSPFTVTFAAHRAIRRSPRHSPCHSTLASPFLIHFFQSSLYNVRRAVRHSPFTIHRSLSHSPRRARVRARPRHRKSGKLFLTTGETS